MQDLPTQNGDGDEATKSTGQFDDPQSHGWVIGEAPQSRQLYVGVGM
jgi:hypothetical protein